MLCISNVYSSDIELNKLISKNIVNSNMSNPSIFYNIDFRDFENVFTFAEFFEIAMFNQSFGYYAKAKIDFKETGLQTASSTDVGNFHIKLLKKLYKIWQEMVKENDINQGEVFEIYEFGAGNGDLAYNILLFKEKMLKLESAITNGTAIGILKKDAEAFCQILGFEIYVLSDSEKLQKQDTQEIFRFLSFCKSLHYSIGELSEGLRIKQNRKNREFINKGWLNIYEIDARKIPKFTQEQKIKGVVFSNELIDTLPGHKIKVTPAGDFYVSMVVPVVNQKFYKIGDGGINKDSLRDKFGFKFDEEEVVLSKKLFFELMAKDIFQCKGEIYVQDKIYMKEVFVPLKKLPPAVIYDIDKYLQGDLMDFWRYNAKLREKDLIFCVQPGIDLYMKGVGDVLSKGFVITIDYGGSSDLILDIANKIDPAGTLVRCRDVSALIKNDLDIADWKQKYPLDEFSFPNSREIHFAPSCFVRIGKRDVTYMVDFHHLLQAGNRGNLEHVYFGKQAGYLDMKDINSQRFLDPFYVLVQRKKGTRANILDSNDKETILEIEFTGLAEELKNQGNIFFKSQTYEKAIEKYSEAISFNNQNSKYFSNRGIAFKKLGEYDEAIKDFKRAIELDEYNIKAYSNLCDISKKNIIEKSKDDMMKKIKKYAYLDCLFDFDFKKPTEMFKMFNKFMPESIKSNKDLISAA